MYAIEFLYYPAGEQGPHVGWAFSVQCVAPEQPFTEGTGPYRLIPEDQTEDFEGWLPEDFNFRHETGIFTYSSHDLIDFMMRWGAPSGFVDHTSATVPA